MKRFLLFSVVAAALLTLLPVSGSAVSAAPQDAPSAWASCTYYVVRPGDTLYSIGLRHRLSAWTIAYENGISNPNRIYVGQVLCIPTNFPPPYPPKPQPRPTVNVGIYDDYFWPGTIYVARGTTVRWTNHGYRTHTTTSYSGFWDSGYLGHGGVFSHTFWYSGTYYYYCRVHPYMRGTVVVW